MKIITLTDKQEKHKTTCTADKPQQHNEPSDAS